MGEKSHQAETVVGVLGGVKAMSRDFNIPLTTIQSWLKVGFIKPQRYAGLLKKAKELGHPLTWDHFDPRGDKR